MIERSDIEAAAERIHGLVRRTPVLVAALGGVDCVLKLESLQHSGSFKARGAFNCLSMVPPSVPVVAASGGNHGAAVAYAARSLGRTASIFVPEPTPAAKLARIAAYGAEVVRGGAAYADALAASCRFAETTGAIPVHAYDDPAVLAGQGTIGLELEADCPGLTHVLVAVGGGGLLGGIASWFRNWGVQVVGVEPEGCQALTQALLAGRPVPVPVSGIAADSLGARVAGELAVEAALAFGIRTVVVGDVAIRRAQAWLWSELRMVAEPGGAAALAAILTGAWVPPAGSSVAVVLCGANTDPGLVAEAQERFT